MHEPPYRIKNMMPGMIMLWYGSIATIPSGWHLCDGTMSTPDLRHRFVFGLQLGDTPQAAGGVAWHTHAFTGDGHVHELEVGTDIAAGTDKTALTSTDPATGTTDAENHYPPYRLLCYIMKL